MCCSAAAKLMYPPFPSMRVVPLHSLPWSCNFPCLRCLPNPDGLLSQYHEPFNPTPWHILHFSSKLRGAQDSAYWRCSEVHHHLDGLLQFLSPRVFAPREAPIRALLFHLGTTSCYIWGTEENSRINSSKKLCWNWPIHSQLHEENSHEQS